MENNPEIQKILESIDKASKRQLRFARLHCLFSLVTVVCIVILLVQAAGVLPQLHSLISQTDAVMGNLKTVSDELAQMDLAGMVTDVNTLVSTSQSGVQTALQKINALDIEQLNKAIDDLTKIIEPLSKLTDLFR